MSEVISATKLFVGGLDWNVRGQELREAFEQFGEVVFARVILDRETRRSKGFGFVEFADPAAAQSARDGMDGTELDAFPGRTIRVDFAKENPERANAAPAVQNPVNATVVEAAPAADEETSAETDAPAGEEVAGEEEKNEM